MEPRDDLTVVEEIIEEWFSRNFHDWLGYETSLYNHIHTAKEELKTEFINLDRQIGGSTGEN